MHLLSNMAILGIHFSFGGCRDYDIAIVHFQKEGKQKKKQHQYKNYSMARRWCRSCEKR